MFLIDESSISRSNLQNNSSEPSLGDTSVKEEMSDNSPGLVDLNKIVKKIYILESSNGKYNYSKCESQGKFNRSGYGIHSGKYICFDTKEQEDKTLGDWFKKKLETMTLEEALKIYNSANPNYVNNFFNLS